ncbi:MAG: 16S rRNA (guanine(966)-N(2))-methyltransferase RsmD [Candidatus Abyssubacteria bacterium]|nr:16S rRNA (guanine(966)-N(2))-methyltransferase RsmD [Candidatus Abyssubacteria bacterium]
MRITGGEAKGIAIKAPKGARVRPTSDKVREALFATLGEDVPGKRVLDLFAGSGALAIEALSRGAEFAALVEKEPTVARTIESNLQKTGLSDRAKIIRADFRSALRKLGRDKERFDLVFIDPPYQSGLLDEVAEALTKHRVTNSRSIIVVEHFKKADPPESISGLPLARTRDYGQTSLSYYQARG